MSVAEKVIRQWRIQKGVPIGVHLWFDPDTECVRLFAVRGNSEGVQIGLDLEKDFMYSDSYGSVSGPQTQAEPTDLYDHQELDSDRVPPLGRGTIGT